MFNISAWSIKRPVPTIVLFLVLTLAGLVAFTNLGIDSNPNIDVPAVLVEVNQSGAGPEELERNPRSRSALLRLARRTEAPAAPVDPKTLGQPVLRKH